MENPGRDNFGTHKPSECKFYQSNSPTKRKTHQIWNIFLETTANDEVFPRVSASDVDITMYLDSVGHYMQNAFRAFKLDITGKSAETRHNSSRVLKQKGETPSE